MEMDKKICQTTNQGEVKILKEPHVNKIRDGIHRIDKKNIQLSRKGTLHPFFNPNDMNNRIGGSNKGFCS